MQRKELVCNSNLLGRYASNLVHEIDSRYNNKSIYIEKSGRMANAHSILGVLSLSISKGDTVYLCSYCDEDTFNNMYDFLKSNM